jgi:hypothetical protein
LEQQSLRLLFEATNFALVIWSNKVCACYLEQQSLRLLFEATKFALL